MTLPTEPPKLAVAGIVPGDYAGTFSYGPGRAWSVAAENGQLYYTTKAGGPRTSLDAIGDSSDLRSQRDELRKTLKSFR